MLPLLYRDSEKRECRPLGSKPWADPTYWPTVMPNLGRSLQLDSMIASYRRRRRCAWRRKDVD